eukprot:gene51696-5643_t
MLGPRRRLVAAVFSGAFRVAAFAFAHDRRRLGALMAHPPAPGLPQRAHAGRGGCVIDLQLHLRNLLPALQSGGTPSLATAVRTVLGLDLLKEWQRSDWDRRPLSSELLDPLPASFACCYGKA